MRNISITLLWALIIVVIPFNLTIAQSETNTESSVELNRGEVLLLNALPEGVTLDTATTEQINAALSLVASANAQNPQLVRDATIAAVASPKVSNKVTAVTAAVTATSAVIAAVSPTSTNPDEDTSSAIAADAIGEVIAGIVASTDLSDEETGQLISSVLTTADQTLSGSNADETIGQIAVDIVDSVAANSGSSDSAALVASTIVSAVANVVDDASVIQSTAVAVVDTVEDSLSDAEVQTIAESVLDQVTEAAETNDDLQAVVNEIVSDINDDTVAVLSQSGSILSASLF